jgi:hypothetical protein
MLPKELQPKYQRVACIPMFCGSTMYNKKDIESIKVPSNWEMDIEIFVSAHNWMLFSHKDKWNPMTCTSIYDTGEYY